MNIPRIDAHQHFWRLDRGDYGWLTPALASIHRDFLPDDLAPILTRHGIDHSILVQASPTVAETEFLLALAKGTSFVAGVVGWVDFEAADAVAAIARLAADPLLVGLRPMVQDIADDDWLLRSQLDPALRAMIDRDLVFDALLLPRHLFRLVILLARHPDLRVVIDHGAKPPIREGTAALDPWRDAMAQVAAFPNVCCKLSGLATEARPGWAIAELAPFVEHLLQVFGPQRLLWGSDWPVVDLAGGYDHWRAATLELLQPLNAGELAAVLGGNARRVYLARGTWRCEGNDTGFPLPTEAFGGRLRE